MNTAYPPPSGTKSPVLSPTIKSTFSSDGHYPTATVAPFKPYPTLTLQPGPTSTPIPLVFPAKSRAGNIYFTSKSNKDSRSFLGSLTLDSTGKIINEAKIINSAAIDYDPFVFPSFDRSLIGLFGGQNNLRIFNLKESRFENISETYRGERIYNWFPDNKQILYRGSSALYLGNPVTGEYLPLVLPNFGSVRAAAASPNGKYVVFSYSSSPNPSGLSIIETTGQNEHPLVKGGYDITNISWSPDGKKIVFSSAGALQVLNSDGTDQKPYDVALPLCYFLPPVWSPDSHQIAVVTAIGETFCPGWGDDIYKGSYIQIIEVDQGKVHPLITDGSTGYIDPEWSPDGSQIAFSSNRSGSPAIWVVYTDGSNLRQITPNYTQARFPIWQKP
jgi:Tol biopolymer transport system component